MEEAFDFTIEELGKRSIKSPIAMSTVVGDKIANYVTDNQFVRFSTNGCFGCRRSPRGLA